MTVTPERLQDEVNRLKLDLKNLRTETGSADIPVGQYLLERLAQLGVTVRLSSAV